MTDTSLTDLTHADIAELRRLEGAATKGKWFNEGRTVYALNESGTNRFFCSVQGGHLWNTKSAQLRTTPEEIDACASLIAAARNALPRLIDMVERSQTDCENWRIAYADCDLMRQQYSTELADLRRQLAEREAEVERLRLGVRDTDIVKSVLSKMGVTFGTSDVRVALEEQGDNLGGEKIHNALQNLVRSGFVTHLGYGRWGKGMKNSQEPKP